MNKHISGHYLCYSKILPPDPYWTPAGHDLCGTACSHWDVRWTQTLVSGMSCHVHTCIHNVHSCVGAVIVQLLHACFTWRLCGCPLQGVWIHQPFPSTILTLLLSFSLYVSFLFLFLPPLLPLPSSHFLLIMQKQSSSMKSLKAKPSIPGLESVLNVSESGTLGLQFHE